MIYIYIINEGISMLGQRLYRVVSLRSASFVDSDISYCSKV